MGFMSRPAETLPLSMRADGELPHLEPLCAEQAAIAQAYADVLADLARRLAAASEEQAVGLSILLARLQFDAPWAVSEVRRTAPTKLRRQRYISQDVFDRWRQVQAQQPKCRRSDFDEDSSGKTLIHEHVVQRKVLVASLETSCDAAQCDAAQIAETLARVTACVVSRAEDARLREVKGVDGWDRYKQAKPPIGVYDRKERTWHIPRSPEQATGPDALQKVRRVRSAMSGISHW
jgi:hypothetical protein